MRALVGAQNSLELGVQEAVCTEDGDSIQTQGHLRMVTRFFFCFSLPDRYKMIL